MGGMALAFVGIIAFGTLIFVIGRWKEFGITKKPIRIGYFHGGRTMLLFRSYLNNEFKRENIQVGFYTKNLNGQDYYLISDRKSDGINDNNFGKVRGGELIDEVVAGKLEGATVGESSFIKAVSDGKPIVAVALLGHDQKDAPAHAIILRKDIKISDPKALKGKILATRRAGDGDATFLKEFLAQSGLKPGEDVKILEQTDDETWMKGLIDGIFDGGYYHQMAVRSLVESGHAYIYRRLDWVDPEMSQALLVFHKDFVKNNPDKIYKIIKVYMERIQYEHKLTTEERTKIVNGMQMDDYFQNMNLPQYTYPPLVSIDLLKSMRALLEKQQIKLGSEEIESHIDNSFVNRLINENKD